MFAVVGRMGDVLIFTREASADRAWQTAEARRSAGATDVRVYDRDWRVMNAGEAPASPRGDGARSGEAQRITLTAGPLEGETVTSSAPRGRVRVFKGRKPA